MFFYIFTGDGSRSIDRIITNLYNFKYIIKLSWSNIFKCIIKLSWSNIFKWIPLKLKDIPAESHHIKLTFIKIEILACFESQNYCFESQNIHYVKNLGGLFLFIMIRLYCNTNSHSYSLNKIFLFNLMDLYVQYVTSKLQLS